MNKKWNGSISHILRACTARIIRFLGTTKSSCKILLTKSRLKWLASDYWGIKNRALYVEVKVPSGGWFARNSARSAGGLHDKRVGWFNNAVRSSEAPVRRAGADNHYCTTCARLCVFLCARVCLVHAVRGEHTV